MVAHRQVLVTTAHLREDDDGAAGFVVDTLGIGDEFELALDRDTGTLLRVIVRFEGQDVSRLEVTDIAFGEEFPQGIFEFSWPDDATVQDPVCVAAPAPQRR